MAQAISESNITLVETLKGFQENKEGKTSSTAFSSNYMVEDFLPASKSIIL